MCNCIKESEGTASKIFAKHRPEISNVSVEITGVEVAKRLDNQSIVIGTPAKITFDKTLKNGKVKKSTERHFVKISYCPFCGEKIGGE